MSTKKERRTQQLNRHYAALVKLAVVCGLKDINGKRLSSKLRAIEQAAHKEAEDYCNGVISSSDEWQQRTVIHMEKVQALFNNKLNGLFINGDARGYALKIDSDLLTPGGLYADTGLQTDWGGYGLLAPEIDGN